MRKDSHIAAIVAAAGLSSRMGAFKPLLEIGERPLVAHVVDRLHASGVETVVVVTGFRGEEIRSSLADRAFVHFATNESYRENGMLESFQCGLRLLRELRPEGWDGLFLMPGDIPLFRPETVRMLADVGEAGVNGCLSGCTDGHCVDFVDGNTDGRAWVPSWHQKSGHPVLLCRRSMERLESYSGEMGLRGFLHALADQDIVHVPVSDEGILADADTPEDFAELVKRWETPQLR